MLNDEWSLSHKRHPQLRPAPHFLIPCNVASSCFCKLSSSCVCARQALAPYLSSSSRLVMRFIWCSSWAWALSTAASHAEWSLRLFYF